MAGGATVASLQVAITANTQQATSAITGLAALMGKSSLLALAPIAIGAGIAAIGGIALHMAGDFQSGITTIVTGAGEAQKNIGLISKGILQMAVDTGTSTKQLISGLYMIESAGFHGAAALAILKAAAEGAKVGNADLGSVANAVTTVMKDYGSTNITAAQATNILIATVANGKTHMQDLATAVTTVLPAASAMGLKLTDVMAAMATMTAQGEDAASAATHLRQMLLMLEAPSAAATKALKSIGLTTDEVGAEMKKSIPGALQLILNHANATFKQGSPEWVAAMKNIVGGVRSMQGILELTSKTGLSDFNKDVGLISAQVKEGGNSIVGWNLVQGTFNQQMDRAKEAVEVLMISMGEHLLPVATQLMSAIADGLIPTVQNMISFLTGTSDTAEKLRPVLAVLGVAIAGALVAAFVAWAAAAVAAAAATIAATWPVLAVGAAIALLIAGLIWAYKNWGWFRDAVNAAKAVLGDILGFIGAQVIPLFGRLGSFIGTAVGNNFKQLGGAINAVGGFLSKLIGIANAVIAVFQRLVGAIGNAINVAKNAVGGVLSHIPGFATGGTMPVTGLAVVGEQGPELLQLPGGTQITPLTGANAIKGPPGNVAGAFGAGNFGGPNGAPLQSTFVINLDGKQIANSTVKHMPGIIRLATGVRSF